MLEILCIFCIMDFLVLLFFKKKKKKHCKWNNTQNVGTSACASVCACSREVRNSFNNLKLYLILVLNLAAARIKSKLRVSQETTCRFGMEKRVVKQTDFWKLVCKLSGSRDCISVVPTWRPNSIIIIKTRIVLNTDSFIFIQHPIEKKCYWKSTAENGVKYVIIPVAHSKKL